MKYTLQTAPAPIKKGLESLSLFYPDGKPVDFDELAVLTEKPVRGTGNDLKTMIAKRVAKGYSTLYLPPLPLGQYYDQRAEDLAVPDDFRIWSDSPRTCQVLLGNRADATVVAWGQRSSAENIKFLVDGHNGNAGLGVNPANGIVRMQWHSHSTGKNLRFQGFWTPCFLISDHITFEDCRLEGKNFAGMVRVQAGSSNGNLHTRRNYWTGANWAGHMCLAGIQEDSWHSDDDHFGFEPFCLYAEFHGPEYAYSNVSFRSTSFEAWGNRAVMLHSRKISGTMFMPRSGKWDMGTGFSGPQYKTTLEPYALGVAGFESHAFTSGNVSGPNKADNNGQFEIIGAGGDVFNGPLIGGGLVGVFQIP